MAATEKFQPRERLIRYLEKILAEDSEERKEQGGKMIVRDFERLKEFSARVKYLVEVEVSEYFINKKVRELINYGPTIKNHEKTFKSLEYLKDINFDLID